MLSKPSATEPHPWPGQNFCNLLSSIFENILTPDCLDIDHINTTIGNCWTIYRNRNILHDKYNHFCFQQVGLDGFQIKGTKIMSS